MTIAIILIAAALLGVFLWRSGIIGPHLVPDDPGHDAAWNAARNAALAALKPGEKLATTYDAGTDTVNGNRNSYFRNADNGDLTVMQSMTADEFAANRAKASGDAAMLTRYAGLLSEVAAGRWTEVKWGGAGAPEVALIRDDIVVAALTGGVTSVSLQTLGSVSPVSRAIMLSDSTPGVLRVRRGGVWQSERYIASKGTYLAGSGEPHTMYAAVVPAHDAAVAHFRTMGIELVPTYRARRVAGTITALAPGDPRATRMTAADPHSMALAAAIAGGLTDTAYHATRKV